MRESVIVRPEVFYALECHQNSAMINKNSLWFKTFSAEDIYNSRQDEEFVTLIRLYNKQSSMYINAIKKELWSSALRHG